MEATHEKWNVVWWNSKDHNCYCCPKSEIQRAMLMKQGRTCPPATTMGTNTWQKSLLETKTNFHWSTGWWHWTTERRSCKCNEWQRVLEKQSCGCLAAVDPVSNLAIKFFHLLGSFRSLAKLKVLSLFLLNFLVQFIVAQWTTISF